LPPLSAAALSVRRRIFEAFAATGQAPVLEDSATVRELAERHVIVLGDDGRILMAHPFAGHPHGTRVDAGERTWWGNCAWDGLGIVAALGLRQATVTSNGIGIEIVTGEPVGDIVFHIAVPAQRWWEDIAFT
jgi:hypothetical protein